MSGTFFTLLGFSPCEQMLEFFWRNAFPEGGQRFQVPFLPHVQYRGVALKGTQLRATLLGYAVSQGLTNGTRALSKSSRSRVTIVKPW